MCFMFGDLQTILFQQSTDSADHQHDADADGAHPAGGHLSPLPLLPLSLLQQSPLLTHSPPLSDCPSPLLLPSNPPLSMPACHLYPAGPPAPHKSHVRDIVHQVWKDPSYVLNATRPINVYAKSTNVNSQKVPRDTR